jgi:hypothetical protein
MSTYFITVEQAENREIFSNMMTDPYNCKCGNSYALFEYYSGQDSINTNLYIVCDSCHDEFPMDRYL